MGDVHDIADTVITTKNGASLRVRDVAVVEQGPKVRLGQFGRAKHLDDGKIIDNDDVVSGIVLLRKGAESDATLVGIHKKVDELNHGILPPGVQVVPFLDRSDLVHLTTHTVLHNLTEGIVLVAVILLLFLGNLRGALIVTLTIPFALLFASICLQIDGYSREPPISGSARFRNDCGRRGGDDREYRAHCYRTRDRSRRRPPAKRSAEAAHEVQRPVFYSIAIIITAYLPIFTLQRGGRAAVQADGLDGGIRAAWAPSSSRCWWPGAGAGGVSQGRKEWRNPGMVWLTRRYERLLGFAIRWRWATVGLAVATLAGTLVLSRGIGSEFLPHLDEGAIWVRGTLAPSTGQDEGVALANRARILLCSFPEVPQCTSQTGRPDDGTDTTGFFNTEFFVDLKPKEEWRPGFHKNKEELIAAMNKELEKIPGVIWNFSQPIADNMEEAVSGVKGELAVKLYGADLRKLESTAQEIINVMHTIPGVEDLGMFRVIGQPNLNLTLNRDKAARYQINATDVQDAIQTAVGGNAITQVLQGEQRYDLVLRYLPQYRDTREAIENIRLLAPSGERVSLAQLTDVQMQDGAAEIYREASQRYVAIKELRTSYFIKKESTTDFTDFTDIRFLRAAPFA